MTEKMLQTPMNIIMKPKIGLRTIFNLHVNPMSCGCLTWKHELETEECVPVGEQDLATYLKYVD